MRCTSASARSTWRRPAGAGGPPRRVGLPGQPAARRLARAARRRRPAALRRARRAGDAPGAPVRRPGVALALQAIVAGGRAAFYGGAFGEGLLALGGGLFTRGRPRPSRRPTGSTPLTATAFGVELSHDRPELAGLPDPRRGPARRRDRAAGRPGRPQLGAPARRGGHDGGVRPARRAPRGGRRRGAARRDRRARPSSSTSTGPAGARSPAATGDTTYLCTADVDGHGRQPDPVQRLGLRVVARRADDGDQPPQPRPRLQPRARPPRRVPARAAAAAHAVPGDGDARRRAGRRVRHDGRRRPAADPAAGRGPPVPPRRRAPADAIAAAALGAARAVGTGSTRGPRRRRRRSSSRATHRTTGTTGCRDAATSSNVRRRSTPASATPTRSSSSPPARSPPPPTRGPDRQRRRSDLGLTLHGPRRQTRAGRHRRAACRSAADLDLRSPRFQRAVGQIGMRSCSSITVARHRRARRWPRRPPPAAGRSRRSIRWPPRRSPARTSRSGSRSASTA